MGFFRWRPYVPVAERKAQAQKKMDALRKKGKKIHPVHIEGRIIARSFWGKGWCEHLQSFSDYSNRLPRGLTYVRNGSVCHLEIRAGEIEALVSGSEMYKVKIQIESLPTTTWKQIKDKCSGEIGSVLELLQGTLSDKVMAVVSHRSHGLFPKPKEISFSCSCPDWASMCKHVAAVMYGIGHRLDSHPELLFLLRSVDPQELLSTSFVLPEADTTSALESEDLGQLFGIDLDPHDNEVAPTLEKNHKKSLSSKKKEKTPKTKAVKKEVASSKRGPSKRSATEKAAKTKSKESPAKETKKASRAPKSEEKRSVPRRVSRALFVKGQAVEVRQGVFDPDDAARDISGWRGRVESVHHGEEGVLIEIAWDSLTLDKLPREFIEESLREDLDWTRMLLVSRDLLLCDSQDTKADVIKKIKSIEKKYLKR